MSGKSHLFGKIIYLNFDLFSIILIVYLICISISSINTETMPRFDMRDKDGIIFDPIAPRAGEKLVAKCTLVGLTSSDKRHVSNGGGDRKTRYREYFSKCIHPEKKFFFHLIKAEGRTVDL